VIPALSSVLGPMNPAEWNVGSVTGPNATDPTAAGGASGNFAGTLTNAIDSLQQTQTNAASASQAVATGQATDPTQAVTAVENASLAMDLASQIRTKLVDATNTLFQTQV
jgi:flagellar hook-basal body complex protein FliE